jgi:uncharacterized tellurite resistance protein B-like protein
MTDPSQFVRVAINAMASYHKAKKQHEKGEIAISHAPDELGLATSLEFMTAMPPGCWAALTLTSFWGFNVQSADPQLFHGEHGVFVARTPIQQQRGQFFLPYGALKYRQAGTYTADVVAGFLDRSTGAIATQTRTTFKIVLPPPRPWRKVEFLWPLIGLCMAVLKADNEISRDEVRTLKSALTARYQLADHDMESLRLAMKHTQGGDLEQQVAETMRRMPHMDGEDLLEFLAFLGRSDAAMRVGEREVLRTIGLQLGLAQRRVDAVIARYA